MIVNALALILMKVDKYISESYKPDRQSKPRCYRISELALLLPFLFGGALGGYVGMVWCKLERYWQLFI